jgi:hypothetical protein
MSHSNERSLKVLGGLLLAAVTGLGCSVKGIQSQSPDGGTDAGRRDGGKGDVRDAAAGRSVAGNSGSAGASGGVGGFSIYTSYVAGVIATSSSAGGSSSSGGASSSSKKLDAGIFDTNRPDTQDAAGGTGGTTVKLDANLVDAYRPDTRDAALGGSGGTSSSGGAGGTGSRDAWVPDVYIPPDAPFDTAVGGTGGSSSSAAGGSSSTSSTMPALHIYSFSVNNSGAEITVTAGKTVTLFWDVVGATTKEIDHDVGMVIGSSEAITVPSPTVETTYTYTLTVTNSTNDASTDFDEAHAEVKITVVPLAITSFKADPAFIDPGHSSTLTASFVGNDKGTISNGVGEVSNGGGKPVDPSEPTTYTLTVTNRLGDIVTATATVNVTGFDAGTEAGTP